MLSNNLVPEALKSRSLKKIIKQAMNKVDVSKEEDLSLFIPDGDNHLSKENFLRFKEIDKPKLSDLIKENILDRQPQKFPYHEAKKPVSSSIQISELEQTIERAMQKTKVKKDTDLCIYIPHKDKRLHHFTFRKLKEDSPKELIGMIDEHVLSIEPKKYVRKNKTKNSSPSEEDKNSLEATIAKALKRERLNFKDEEDISRYLPNGDSHFHPLGFRSLKKKDPEMLKELIQAHVLDPVNPKAIKWQKRGNKPSQNQNPMEEATHQEKTHIGQESKNDQLLNKISESVELMSQLLQAFQSQNHHNSVENTRLLNKEGLPTVIDDERSSTALRNESLSARYLGTTQKQLIKQIRRKEIDYTLYDTFVELVESGAE